MIIKSLVMKGFKGFQEEYTVDFDEKKTVIEGENYQGKTTIGEAICWCFLGCNLFGNEKTANLINNNSSTAYCQIIFIDNDGVEHTLYRSKGKENSVILDNRKADVEMLSKYYLSKKIFLSVYNPYYFSSLEPKEQRELLSVILPTIDYQEAFELLDKSDQNILEYPRIDLNQFMKNAREDLKELEKEKNNFLGKIQYVNSIINSPIEQEKEFINQDYLNSLEKEYNSILNDKKIKSKSELEIEKNEIEKNLSKKEIELQKIDKQSRELKKTIDDIENNKNICPLCKSEIDNDNIRQIKLISIEKLNELMKNKNDLSSEINNLKVKKSIITIRYNFSTDDKETRLAKLSEKITKLKLEKEEIQKFNYEIQANKKAKEKAKEDLKLLNKSLEENRNEKEMLKMQIEVAKSLNMKIVEKQMEMVKECLDKVKLVFYKVDQGTGEIKDDYKLFYNDKDYNVLSLSEKIKASLEISNLINERVGLKGPTFIDNSESITHYDKEFKNQVIFAKVVEKEKLRLVI